MTQKVTFAACALYTIGMAQLVSMIAADDAIPYNVSNHTSVTTITPHHLNESFIDEEEGRQLSDSLDDNDHLVLEPSSRYVRRARKNDRQEKREEKRKRKEENRKKRNNNKQNNNNRPQKAPQAPQGTCRFPESLYDAIDDDIANIKNGIRNDEDRAHWLGGIVRLAAHDFMDFDRRDGRNPMGADGCYDERSDNNAGLETIWCGTCPLKQLYDRKYSGISRADFWIAASNAVIRQTSVRGDMDLKDTFLWGRRDRDSCPRSGDRLPIPSDCDEVEDVFLKRMGLTWHDAVALLGAHTLGMGNAAFSGHDGTWVESNRAAQVFDKGYYEELFTNAWRPRRMGGRKQDWTTGFNGNGKNRVMLNTDMCLVFDIDEHIRDRVPCCSRTNTYYQNGLNQCIDREATRRRCPMYSGSNPRRQATDAVREMLGGSVSSNNQKPFYNAFARAWRKATTVGQDDLKPLC
eukprot:CAMPEP_0183721494 /NCGR_PEP_ID=MMETSP0737-20130205/13753_1 /TAXON_ID=385413 /ORGANISM="Thalassiosira miniscula, Strain CCMP1093" /LENGTH=461 /DNA_ID=CAMNT_0025951507 /DNA_START=66 /DNA_END=1451 /DNA_ORIENTATION=-